MLVIDYFIVSKHLLTNTISFQVISATESCHLPISLVIDGQCNIPRPHEDTEDTITYKYHLTRDDCDMYLRLISESILKGCFDKVDDLINISTAVDSVIDEHSICMKTNINIVVDLSSVDKRDKRHRLFNRTLVVVSFSMCCW